MSPLYHLFWSQMTFCASFCSWDQRNWVCGTLFHFTTGAIRPDARLVPPSNEAMVSPDVLRENTIADRGCITPPTTTHPTQQGNSSLSFQNENYIPSPWHKWRLVHHPLVRVHRGTWMCFFVSLWMLSSFLEGGWRNNCSYQSWSETLRTVSNQGGNAPLFFLGIDQPTSGSWGLFGGNGLFV